MRTIAICLMLALLAAPMTAAEPDAVREVKETVAEKEHCFLIMAEPFDEPDDFVSFAMNFATCMAGV